MRISWQLRMITLLVILASRKPSAFCQYAKPCNFNQMCTCKMEETRSEITCIRVPFYKLPDLLPEQYTHIDIMTSNIETIENDAFGMAQIESIRLMNNQIIFVANRAFSSMENVLRSLDLSYNKLTHFPYKALHSVNHMDWLNLHSNEISTINSENDYFQTWSRIKASLQTLFIGDNDIIDISKNTLTYYERLTWLNLDANKISSISWKNLPITLRTLSYCHNYVQNFPADMMENIPDLTRLYVRGNYIRQLPLHALRSSKRMDKLDLGENLIELVEGNSTTHTFTVRDLHLDFNKIRTLPSHAFKGISVARLYLSRNGMEYIDEKAFVDIANSLEYLDLEHNNLAEIPFALSTLKRLKYLYISSNKIANISTEVLDNFCFTLKAISLSGNQLTKVPKSALKRCTKLSHLNLGYNYIREINEQDFSDWGESLDTVLLRNNRISEITSHTFRQTPKLRELSLSFNKITNIHEQAFSDLRSSLESLEISFGLFQEEFSGEFLKPLTHLLWLALDNNNINLLHDNAFHALQNLQYLNLDTNFIASIPVGLFSAVAHSHLKDIRFSNNHVSVLHAGTFQQLNELQNIVLCRNQLRKIENRSFVNLPNLVNVVLSGNQISQIDPNAFVNIPNLMKLDLQNNNVNSFDLNVFHNVSSSFVPLSINISSNQLSEIIVSFNTTPLYVKYADLSVNNLIAVPREFLDFCSHSITQLDLSYNQITFINESTFKNLTSLEQLSLNNNFISIVHKKSFVNLPNLQILDLSQNKLDYLPNDAFKTMKNLRILNLSNNNLRSLARDIFSKTILESLDLSSNLLNVMPSSSINEVGETLRKLDLSNNHIEHLDSTMFVEVPTLSFLSLASNKLNILPDNVFTSIGNLLTLDISSNPLRANFKELFHYVQKLRSLNLADTGLTDVPHLPLPNLVTLRLSKNRIEKLSSASIDNLVQLRRLYLDNNRFKVLPSNVWSHLPLLKELDVSSNPIKVISKDSFFKLPRLQTLNIQYLKYLERFDVDSLSQNKVLTNLKVDTFPSIDRSRFHLGNILSTLPSLRSISVRVLEEKLEDQLFGAFHSKLKEIEITGPNLKYIRRGALKGIEKTYDLVLRIRHTLIEDFPAGLFEGIQNIAHLSLDLSNNRLVSLSPTILYSNITSWENVGTKLLDGGLVLKDNLWSCDCGLVWLGHWLRRWLREAIEIHTLIIKEAQQMENIAREATCLDQRTNRRIPIVDLHPEDLSCQASALSGDGSSSHLLGNHLVGCLIKTILVISLTHYIWLV